MHGLQKVTWNIDADERKRILKSNILRKVFLY